MGTKKNIDIREIERLYHLHKSVHPVAEHFGCSKTTICNKMREAGIARVYLHRKGIIPKNKRTYDESAIIAYYRQTESQRKTGDMFGCSMPTVRTILLRNGIKPYGKPKIDDAFRKRSSENLKARQAAGEFSGEKHWNWRGAKVVTRCTICGKEMLRFKCNIRKFQACDNPACRSAAASAMAKAIGLGGKKGPDNVNWKGDELNANCVVCGKEFRRTSKNDGVETCREGDCHKKLIVSRYGGEKSWRWRGGVSTEPYPWGWSEDLKESIRKRDGYKCQECGKDQSELKRRLHVHHIGYDKNDLDPRHLITLCDACHGKTNHDRPYWQARLQMKVNAIMVEDQKKQEAAQ